MPASPLYYDARGDEPMLNRPALHPHYPTIHKADGVLCILFNYYLPFALAINGYFSGFSMVSMPKSISNAGQ